MNERAAAPWRSLPWVVVLGLTLVGGFLRWPDPGYWFNADEAQYWAAAATASWADLRHEIRYQAHPLPYFILLRCWAYISLDPQWLRLSSWLPGTLLIPLTFIWVRRLRDAVAGVIAQVVDGTVNEPVSSTRQTPATPSNVVLSNAAKMTQMPGPEPAVQVAV